MARPALYQAAGWTLLWHDQPTRSWYRLCSRRQWVSTSPVPMRLVGGTKYTGEQRSDATAPPKIIHQWNSRSIESFQICIRTVELTNWRICDMAIPEPDCDRVVPDPSLLSSWCGKTPSEQIFGVCWDGISYERILFRCLEISGIFLTPFLADLLRKRNAIASLAFCIGISTNFPAQLSRSPQAEHGTQPIIQRNYRLLAHILVMLGRRQIIISRSPLI